MIHNVKIVEPPGIWWMRIPLPGATCLSGDEPLCEGCLLRLWVYFATLSRPFADQQKGVIGSGIYVEEDEE